MLGGCCAQPLLCQKQPILAYPRRVCRQGFAACSCGRGARKAVRDFFKLLMTDTRPRSRWSLGAPPVRTNACTCSTSCPCACAVFRCPQSNVVADLCVLRLCGPCLVRKVRCCGCSELPSSCTSVPSAWPRSARDSGCIQFRPCYTVCNKSRQRCASYGSLQAPKQSALP
jgi:hypothetical protein